MKAKTLDYINKFDILDSNQYGFRQLHSTSMAILDFVEGRVLYKCFLDLAKAFDTDQAEVVCQFTANSPAANSTG